MSVIAPAIPSLQKAVIQGEGGAVVIANIPVPQPAPDEIIVRNAAVACNPCDVKVPNMNPVPGLLNGCDFAGTVVAVGKGAVNHFEIGDRVFGAVEGSKTEDPLSGAYCEYIKAEHSYIFKIPSGMSFEEAAAMPGTAIATAGLALHWSLKIEGSLDKPANYDLVDAIFIHGGASTCGLITMQMAKLCGHQVITTCSPKNIELVRSYGADMVFDYHSPSCGAEIRKYTNDCVRYIIDPFADVRSTTLCYEAMGRGGGKYCAPEQYQQAACTRKRVKAELIMGQSIKGFEVNFPDLYYVPPNKSRQEWSIGFYQRVQEVINEGKLRPCPIQLIQPGGFQGILNGRQMVASGGVSGKKLIVPMA